LGVCYNPPAKDYFRWADAPALNETETDEGFSLEDLLQHISRLELTALGYVTYEDVPPREGA
jgi:hypothetical protein